MWAQSPPPASTPANAPASTSAKTPPQNSPAPNATSSTASTPERKPNIAPRSDRINVEELGDEPGQSSSKEERMDLSPPAGDAKAHPMSTDALTEGEAASGDADTTEFHPWDPHKAAKDVEVGDFYFKRKNYSAAESRYREALLYKDNDAIATFRLAVCLDKLDRPDEALQEYENYLKILPFGPEAPIATKAITRLKTPSATAKPTK